MFTPQQPDLNWRNPQVRQEMLDVFRFWLDRGVDGFRLDVFNEYFKDKDFRNNPRKPGIHLLPFDRYDHIYDTSQPEMFAPGNPVSWIAIPSGMWLVRPS